MMHEKQRKIGEKEQIIDPSYTAYSVPLPQYPSCVVSTLHTTSTLAETYS